jgi:hypothetical protein
VSGLGGGGAVVAGGVDKMPNGCGRRAVMGVTYPVATWRTEAVLGKTEGVGYRSSPDTVASRVSTRFGASGAGQSNGVLPYPG